MNWLGENLNKSSDAMRTLINQNPGLFEEAIYDQIHAFTSSGDMSDYDGDFKEDIKNIFDEDNILFTEEKWQVIWEAALNNCALWAWRNKVWKCCCKLLGEDSDTDFFQNLDYTIINSDPVDDTLPAVWQEDDITLPLYAIGQAALSPRS